MIVLSVILTVTAVAILVPVSVFCLECLLALLIPGRKRSAAENAAPQVAVLIPAHNESGSIEATLNQLLPTLDSGDRAVVIADNCTDGTAELARSIGAEVIERRDSSRRGKAFALQFGLEHLENDPPDVVVVLDADCFVEETLVRRISRLAHSRRRPVQCRNLCARQSSSGGVHAVSELGFRFKNLVRPLGLSRLGMPCQLMGTGMAIPWDLFQKARLAEDHLAEDMQFGIELALQGHPTLFCPEVGITSALPRSERAFLSQRTRWEQGHIHTSLTQIPRLFAGAILRGRLDLLCLALDLTVPPLSLLVIVWLLATLVTSAAGLLGASWLPAVMLAIGGLAMFASILAGWAVFCRSEVPWKSLLRIPGYILRKVPIYVSYFLGRREKEWIRTQRGGPRAKG